MSLRKATDSQSAVIDNSYVANGILQRQCNCGRHTIGGGECSACSKKRGAVQHAAVSSERAGGFVNTPGQSAETTRSLAPDWSQIPTRSSRRDVEVPAAPTNSFEDCPADWKTKANEALARGRPWVSNVITGLSNLPDPIPAPVARLLNRHFHTTWREDIRKIVGHFNTIYSAMNASIDFECETECDANVAAYVYSIWTDLHLCPVWYGLSANGQANTIIHELAHDAANRDDEAYVWQAKYATLSVDDAIDNADSYSYFAEEAQTP